MNLAALQALSYKQNTRARSVIFVYPKTFTLLVVCATCLLTLYIVFAVLQIGTRHDIIALKSEIKLLQERNSEYEVALASAHINEPTEAYFSELGLVKSKNVSYIEMPLSGLVRASTR